LLIPERGESDWMLCRPGLGDNMHIQVIRFLPIKRPPAVAVAGTVTLLLIVATIVVAVLGMLPR